MALSQDLPGRRRRGPADEAVHLIGTGSTVYVGSVVQFDTATGRIVPADAATGRRVAGVVERLTKGANGSGIGTGVGDAAGNQSAIIGFNAEYQINVNATIRTNAALGVNVFSEDDDTVSGTAAGTAATLIEVGELREFIASDKSTAWVAVRQFANDNVAT